MRGRLILRVRVGARNRARSGSHARLPAGPTAAGPLPSERDALEPPTPARELNVPSTPEGAAGEIPKTWSRLDYERFGFGVAKLDDFRAETPAQALERLRADKV